jgi:hypothetical protein
MDVFHTSAESAFTAAVDGADATTSAMKRAGDATIAATSAFNSFTQLAPGISEEWRMAGATSGTGLFGQPWWMQTRQAGGPVEAGTPYLVGERGPELFVPRTAGTIAAGGANITNTFHLVDTESNLARRVAEIVMQSVRNGVRLNAI